MSYKARATTDGKGMRPICGGLFRTDLKAQSLGQAGVDIWSIDITLYSTILVKLLNQDKFNLLASRLINVEGYHPNTEVMAGHKPSLTAIEIGDKKYRARGNTIYEKKV
ncbi:hypothetical protein ACFL0K_00255 [Patescibacteria group bacterium]